MFSNIIKGSATVALAVLMTVGTIGPIVYSSDVEAKRFGGGGGFSSRSFSRSSFRPSSSPKKSQSQTSKKPLFSSSKKTTSTSKTGAKRTTSKTVSKTSQARASRAALSKQRAKFTKKPATTTSVAGTKKKYGSNQIYTRASSYDRGTYSTRRSTYYNSIGYTPAPYVYSTYPSFGLWDTIFLYSLLNSNNHSFAYHHQNDPDYIAWRREADRLANDNADLRRQLASMDAGVTGMAGTAIDPNYMPAGVDADLALSQEALTSQKPTLRICVGPRSGTYYGLTTRLLAPSLSSVNAVAVPTSGSGEILQKVSDGSCDAGFVQSDSYWNFVEENHTTSLPFERIMRPYREAMFLMCNVNGVSEMSDLSNNSTVLFPRNSGAAETWKNIVAENGNYRGVRTVLNSPGLVVDTYEDALLGAGSDKNTCALYVGAHANNKASKFMKKADGSSTSTDLVLVDIDDASLLDTTDPASQRVYSRSELEGDVYPKLLRQNGIWGTSWFNDADTLEVSADFIISTKWKTANKESGPTILDLKSMSNDIRRAVEWGM